MRPTHIAVWMDPSLTSISIHVVVVITMPLQRIEESPGDGLVRTDSSERRNALDRKGRLRWAANSTGPSTGSRGRCRRRVGESTSSSSPAARTSRARPKPRIIDSPRPHRAERERSGAAPGARAEEDARVHEAGRAFREADRRVGGCGLVSGRCIHRQNPPRPDPQLYRFRSLWAPMGTADDFLYMPAGPEASRRSARATGARRASHARGP